MQNMEQKIQQFVSILKSKGVKEEDIQIDQKNQLIKIRHNNQQSNIKFSLIEKLSRPKRI